MNTKKTKLLLLLSLLCVLVAIGYQNNFWNVLYFFKKTSVLAVTNKQISQFSDLSKIENTIEHHIVQFFDIDTDHLKDLRRTFYDDWRKQKYALDKLSDPSVSKDQYDLIVLPTLLLEKTMSVDYPQKLARIISEEIDFQQNQHVLPATISALELGGNHTLFDGEYVRKLARYHNAKVLYLLNKSFQNTTNTETTSEISLVLTDSEGKIARSKTIQFSTSRSTASPQETQNWTLAQLDVSKAPLVREFFQQSHTTIHDYTANFFRNESYKLEDACNSESMGRWESAEKARHSGLVSEGAYDIIVLPVQEIHPRNDRVGRLLSSRLIAQEIELRTGKKVMSPELALRLLGCNQIVFDVESINHLAKQSAADIVYLLKRKKPVKFSRNSAETELAAILADSTGNILQSSFHSIGEEDALERIPYSKEKDYRKNIEEISDTLEIQVNKLKSNIVQAIFPDAKKTSLKEAPQVKQWTIPNRISDIPDVASSPLDAAAYLQLLALVTPEILIYERRRLLERSLLALQTVNEDTENYNLLTARALFHLYRRPFSLSYLSQVRTPAEKAFYEYIHGNLTDLDALTSDIQDPLLHTIATIEKYQLRYSYFQVERASESLKVPNNAWFSLIEYATHDNDIWYAPENIQFFLNLNGLYPEFDATLEKYIYGNSIVNDTFNDDHSINIISGTLSIPSGTQPEKLDFRYAARITNADIWNLYRNIAIGNMLKSLRRSVEVHASFDTALDKAKKLENILTGHPVYLYLYAKTLTQKARELKGIQRARYLEQALDLNDKVFYNTCGVTQYTLKAEQLLHDELKEVLKKDRQYIPAPKFYGRSIDQGCYPTLYLQPAFKELALPFTHDNISPLPDLAEKIGTDYVLGILQSRFDGHPEKASLQANFYFDQGEDDKGIDVLEGALASGDTSWSTVYSLAGKYVDQEFFQKAQSTLLQYRSFQDTSRGNRVHTCGYAYRAGRLFLDKGHFKEAKPFFEIAASLHTGAASQYRSAALVALLEKDFPRVLEYSQAEAKRYNSINAYNTFLTFLHILGYHSESEAGYQALIERNENHSLFESQFIGSRIQRESALDIVEHLNSIPTTSTSNQQLSQKFSATLTSDRLPSATDIELLSNIEQNGSVKLENSYAQDKLNQDFIEKLVPLLSEYRIEEDEEVLGSFSCFVRMFTETYEQNYAKSLAIILHFISRQQSTQEFTNGLNQPYFLDDPVTKFMLPYLSMAATKLIDDVHKINEFEEQLTAIFNKPYYERRLFDLFLSKAIVQARLKNPQESLNFLQKAFEDSVSHYESETYRPFFSRRLQLLQISEWLYAEYGDKRYLHQALSWAEIIQTVTPQYAWGHAFEALYGEKEEDRIESAAIAHYLDPDSRWLSMVDPHIRREASTWWDANNPFTTSEGGTTEPAKEEI